MFLPHQVCSMACAHRASHKSNDYKGKITLWLSAVAQHKPVVGCCVEAMVIVFPAHRRIAAGINEANREGQRLWQLLGPLLLWVQDRSEKVGAQEVQKGSDRLWKHHWFIQSVETLQNKSKIKQDNNRSNSYGSKLMLVLCSRCHVKGFIDNETNTNNLRK